MDAALQLPGISNAWTMPIKGRLDMLSTGIRTPVGIKIMGADLTTIERIALEIEAAVQQGARERAASTPSAWPAATSSISSSSATSWRATACRVDDANMMVMTAVGGDNQSTTVEGRERYGINVRYARDYREDLAGAEARALAAARAARARSRWRRSPTSSWSRARP